MSNLGGKCWGQFRSTTTKVDHQRKGATPPIHPQIPPYTPPPNPLCIIVVVVDVGSPHKINHLGCGTMVAMKEILAHLQPLKEKKLNF